MTQYADAQQIDASPVERQALAEAITEANAAEVEHKRAQKAAARAWTLFCEGKGVPGATFVGITTEGKVLVTMPESKPELVKNDAA